MADDADWLAGSNKGLDQFDGMLVCGEIPQWAHATWIEDDVEFSLFDAVDANGLIELSFRSSVLPEPEREVSTEFAFVALGIEGGRPPFGRP